MMDNVLGNNSHNFTSIELICEVVFSTFKLFNNKQKIIYSGQINKLIKKYYLLAVQCTTLNVLMVTCKLHNTSLYSIIFYHARWQ